MANGHDAALSIHKLLSGEDITERPLPDVQVSSQKMGIHEWSYDNDISNDKRYKVPHRDKVIALKDIRAEVELGNSKKLRIEVKRTSPSDAYIESVTLNGKPHHKLWFKHSDIADGAVLEFTMGPQPSPQFGAGEDAVPPTLTS